MLSRLDDYPVHQAPVPLLGPATSDRNVYDRYWMNGFDRDGEFYFAVGLARYQHRGIQDAEITLLNTSHQPHTYSFGIKLAIHVFVKQGDGLVPGEADAWLAELIELGKSEQYFFSINRYLFTATKP